MPRIGNDRPITRWVQSDGPHVAYDDENRNVHQSWYTESIRQWATQATARSAHRVTSFRRECDSRLPYHEDGKVKQKILRKSAPALTYRTGLFALVILALVIVSCCGAWAQSCKLDNNDKCLTIHQTCSPVDTGTGDKGKCDVSCTCVGAPPPPPATYSLALTPLAPSTSISSTSMVTLSPQTAYHGIVSLSCAVTGPTIAVPGCSFSARSLAIPSGTGTPSSTLTITTNNAAPFGGYTVTVSAVDEAGAGPRNGPQSLSFQISPNAQNSPPVWGLADLHTHPATFLGFGADKNGRNGLIWGKPAHDTSQDANGCIPWLDPNCTQGLDLATSLQYLATDLPPCPYGNIGPLQIGYTHNNTVGADPVTLMTDTQAVYALDATSPGWTHQAGGYPDFSTDNANGWQAALTVDHQEMHIDNIHRAYLGGLRLMFASATDNEIISDLWNQGFNAGGNPKPVHDPGFDRRSAERQLTYISNLVNANSSWMQIVTTPEQARQAINNNKLAVVLSLELESLSVADIRYLVQKFGVRHVIPIHLSDNKAFGGTAIYSDTFNALSNFINGAGEQSISDANVNYSLSQPVQQVSDVSSILKTESLPVSVGALLLSTLGPTETALAAAISADMARQQIGLGSFFPGGAFGYLPQPLSLKTPPYIAPGQINSMDLNQPNFEALMQMGLMLDIAHMGQKSASSALNLALKYYYSLMDSHTGIRCDFPNSTTGFPALPCKTDFSHATFGPYQPFSVPPSPGQWPVVNERGLPRSQVEIIRKLHGVIGMGLVPTTFDGGQQVGNNAASSTPFVVPVHPLEPNGSKWVFFQGTDNALWKIKDDGTDQTRITNAAYGDDSTLSTPFVLPDSNRDGGNWIFFQGTDNKLWKVRDDGSQQAQIGDNTTSSTPYAVPDPKGGALVFFRGTDNALWKVKDDGTEQAHITSPIYGKNYTISMPFVLPDTNGGNWIFFQGTDNKLWKVHDDGSRQAQIGNNTTASTPFAVSDPNGGAWVFFRGTDNSLWKIKDDGTQQSRLSNARYGDNSTLSTPFVLPDPHGGNWVYFQGTDNTLWKVRDDGSQQSRNGVTASRPFVTNDGWVYFLNPVPPLPFPLVWRAHGSVVDDDPVTNWINAYAATLKFMGGKAVAIGTDVDGLSPLIQKDTIPTPYPIKMSDFGCPSPNCPSLTPYTFGERTFDFQQDGIANYGMLPDFIQAASQPRPGFLDGRTPPKDLISALYHSAEDTIQMWELVETPRLNISLSVLSANGGNAAGVFNLNVDGTTWFPSAGDGTHTGPIAIPAGAHKVSATPGTGVNVGDYAVSFAGDCDSNGSVTLATADRKTCIVGAHSLIECNKNEPGYAMCSGNCVQTSTDSGNCGKCGKSCAVAFVCKQGSCVSPCPSDYTMCSDGSCVPPGKKCAEPR